MKRRFILILIASCILVAAGYSISRKNTIKHFEEVLSTRLAEKGITDATVTFEKTTHYSGSTFYYFMIDSDQFRSLPNAEKVRVYDYVDVSYVIPEFYSNGDEYSISTYDGTATILKNLRKIYDAPTDRRQEQLDKAKEKDGNKMPFEGLEEEYISCTKLGEPSSVELSQDFYAMKYIRRTKAYLWHDAEGNLICKATVYYNTDGVGTVRSVYLPGSRLVTPAPTKRPVSTSRPSSSGKSDPFDAKSYAHPDDFYYDYRDDFIDYEEAEEYWEKHN